jgi:hypothetical protein
MAAFIKSTNINNYDINGFIDPEYVGIATVITCLGRLEVEIYDKMYINGRHFENPNWPP